MNTKLRNQAIFRIFIRYVDLDKTYSYTLMDNVLELTHDTRNVSNRQVVANAVRGELRKRRK